MLTDLFRQLPSVAVWPTEANELWHPAAYPWATSALDAPPYFVDGRSFTEASLAAWPRGHGERVRRAMGWFQRLARRDRFMVKTVTVSYMLPKLLELFPDARLVNIVRDPYAVAASQLAKDRAKLTDAKYARFGVPVGDEDRLTLYARHWGDEMQAIRVDAERLGLGEERYRELSYDSFCRQPASSLADLLAWLEITPPPDRQLAPLTAHVTFRQPEGEPPTTLRPMFDDLRSLRR